MFLFFFTLILLYKDVLVKNLTNWFNFKKVLANVMFYVVYLVASVLSLFVIYRTSRGAMLGVIGGIFVAAILIFIFEKDKKVISLYEEIIEELEKKLAENKMKQKNQEMKLMRLKKEYEENNGNKEKYEKSN